MNCLVDSELTPSELSLLHHICRTATELLACDGHLQPVAFFRVSAKLTGLLAELFSQLRFMTRRCSPIMLFASPCGKTLLYALGTFSRRCLGFWRVSEVKKVSESLQSAIDVINGLGLIQGTF
jgi:hypothetical protein